MYLIIALGGALIFYLLAGLAQIRNWRHIEHEALPIVMPLVGVALLLHALVLAPAISTATGINLALPVAVAMFAFALTALVWLLSLIRPFHHLLTLAVPASLIALAGLALTTGDTRAVKVLSLAQSGLWLHIPLALAAYTVITLSFFQAILLLVQENGLRGHKPLLLDQVLPPLVVMELQLFQMLQIGVVLLTLAILSGFIFLDDMFSQRVVHHTVLSVISWLVLVALLLRHHLSGWRGRSASKWMIAGFVPLLLAYFGSKFVLEVILNANGGSG